MNRNSIAEALRGTDPALEMRYPQAYRQVGIRFTSQLGKPTPLSLHQLPEIEYGIFHYYSPKDGDEREYGIPSSHPLVADKEMHQCVYHVTDYAKVSGNYRKLPVRKLMMVRAYHKANPSLFWVRDATRLNKLFTRRTWNIVVDYALMDYGVIFRPNILQHIWKFETRYTGYLTGIKDILAKNSLRQQFMFFHLPDTLPTYVQFRQASKEYSRKFYSVFPGYKSLQLLDLFKWLSDDHRKDSLLYQVIGEKHLANLNFIFLYKGNVAIISADLLNKWIAGKEKIDDEKEVIDVEDVESGIDESKSTRIQKRIFNFFRKFVQEVDKTAKPVDIEIETLAESQAKEIEQIYDTASEAELADDKFQDPETVSDEAPPVSTISAPTPMQKKEDAKPDTVANVITPDIPKDTSSPKDDTVSVVPNTPVDVSEPVKLSSAIDVQVNKAVIQAATELSLTEREKGYWERVAQTYHKLPSPEKGVSLAEYIEKPVDKSIKKEDTTIPDMPMVLDKTMLNSTLKSFNKDYIKNSLKRDVVKSITNIQKTGIAITDYQVEEDQSVSSHFEIHSVQFTPIGGSPSTVKLRLPKVQPDGTFLKSMVKYRLRNQRRDKPIRKVSDHKASLTSYYGKLFITTSEQKKFNRSQYIQTLINKFTIDGTYTDVRYGQATSDIKQLPTEIKLLMERVQSFKTTVNGRVIQLNLSKITQQDNKLLFGSPGVSYDLNKQMFIIANKYHSTADVLKFSPNELPLSYAEVKILGEMMPVGFVLARSLGFSNLVKKLNVPVEKIEASKRIQLEPHQFQLRFGDERWVFDKRTLTERNRLILAGFLKYEKYLKQYSVYDFDTPDVYGAILAEENVTVRYERELDLIEELFVDPMTEELLVQMKEPTNINDLYIRATELLSTTDTVEEINMKDMVIKGYERIPGAVYQAMVQNLRQFKSKPITHKRKFTMKPDDALLLIANDPTIEVADEINPLHNLKEKSVVTFTGEGGRSRRSMVQRTRGYSDTDAGIISEATVDSVDVGITTYLSANPSLTSQTGSVNVVPANELNSADIYSTTGLLSPFLTHDDKPFSFCRR